MELNRGFIISRCAFLTENIGIVTKTVSVTIKYDTLTNVKNVWKNKNVEDFSSQHIIIRNIRSGFCDEKKLL